MVDQREVGGWTIGASYDVCFSTDGGFLAATRKSQVVVFDTASRQELAAFPMADPASVDFSPDGSRLLVKTTSGAVALVELGPGIVRSLVGSGSGDGADARFVGGGDAFIDCSRDGEFALRSAVDGAVVASHRFEGARVTWLGVAEDRLSWCVACAYGRGRPVLAVGRLGAGGTWGLSFSAPVKARWSGGMPGAVAPSPDGRTVALRRGRCLDLVIPETRRGSRRSIAAGAEDGIAWLADDRLAVVTADGVEVVSIPGLSTITSYSSVPDSASVAYSPSQRLLAIGSWEAGLVVANRQARE